MQLAKPPKVIAIASGKGGVGKSSLCAMFALLLAKAGCRVLLVDADLALGNLHMLLGVKPKFNLFHVLSGRISIEEAICPISRQVDLLPSSSGNQWMANLIQSQHFGLIEAIGQLPNPYDVVLIDTGSGISHHVTSYLHASPHILLVTTPELSSEAGAYALMKVIRQQKGNPRFHLLVNHCESSLEGSAVFAKISKLTEKFLSASLDFMGQIPKMTMLNDYLTQLSSTVSQAVGQWVTPFEVPITQILRWPTSEVQGSVQFFFERLLEQVQAKE